MSAVANFIWILFGGWVSWLLWLLAGCLAYISIIGIPYGRACFTIASMALRPFGRVVIPAKDLKENGRLNGRWGIFFNVIWAIPLGLVLAVTEAALGVLYCMTIVGIPVGLQAFKLAHVSFAPVGKKIVDKEVVDELRRRKAVEIVDQAMA